MSHSILLIYIPGGVTGYVISHFRLRIYIPGGVTGYVISKYKASYLYTQRSYRVYNVTLQALDLYTQRSYRVYNVTLQALDLYTPSRSKMRGVYKCDYIPYLAFNFKNSSIFMWFLTVITESPFPSVSVRFRIRSGFSRGLL